MRRGCRLGIDVGSTRVGLAACDAQGILATPVATLRRKADHDFCDKGPAFTGSTDLDEIVAAALRLDVIEVVVGLPLSLSGHEGAAARDAREYALALSHRLDGVHVRLLDERLTTVDASRALRAAGRSSRQQRMVIDQVAAVLILQAALDLERASGRPPGEAVGGRKARHAGRSGRRGLERPR